jgi:hypothetical protein
MSDVIKAKKGKKDAYSNIAYASVLQSAANTLTFAQINMGVGLFQGVALLLHRIQWYPFAAALRELVTAADSMDMALTTSNRLTAIYDVLDPSVICVRRLLPIAATVAPYDIPLISDFTMLPGGGKLIAANPLWIACGSLAFAAAAQIRAQLDFTFISLTDAEYLELLQATYPANIS